MSKPRLDRPLEASLEVATSPEEVWSVIADLARTGEWSSECSRVVPLGKVRKGAWLLGFNRRRWVRWATVSRVVHYEPQREIAWRVLTNRAVWTYRLAPTRTGTRIVERRDTPRGVSGFARGFTRLLLDGQAHHDDELEAAMSTGLQRIKTVAEGSIA